MIDILVVIVPAVIAFITLMSSKNPSLKVMQVIALIGWILLVVLDLLFSPHIHIWWILASFGIAEFIHLILLGTGAKVPVLLHEWIVCVGGLFPWFDPMIVVIIGICIFVLGVVGIIWSRKVWLLPIVHETRTQEK